MNLLILSCQIIVVYSLSCYDVLELPEDTKITINDLKSLSPMETVQCLSHLGKDQMPKEEADYIWNSIIRFHGSIAEIPDKILMQMHWITPAIAPEDYANITLGDIDIIQNFGLNYGLTDEQLSAIAERVREDFAGKEPEDYTYYDLTALRQILCAFNQSEIERIHPSAYKEAALVIGKLENCKPTVLAGFATLAVHPSAFGPPSGWSKSTFEALGSVAGFFPKEIMSKRSLASH